MGNSKSKKQAASKKNESKVEMKAQPKSEPEVNDKIAQPKSESDKIAQPKSEPGVINKVAEPEVIDETMFPLTGISIAYLRTLDVDPDKKMYDVCTSIVIPKTIEPRVSFAKYLMDDPELSIHVKPRADVFISYAWGYTWKQLMEALEGIEGFAWIDLFVVNQHVSSEVDLDQWLTTFRTAIKAIGKVVFVLAPWEHPIPVTRAWCVFEILTALQTQVERRIVVPTSEREALVKAILSGELGGVHTNDMTLLSALGKINVMRAVAYKEEDRVAIMDKIKQQGILDVNNVVLLPIKAWYLEAIQLAIDERTTPNTMERGNAYEALYQFLELLGKPQEGFKAIQDAYNCWKAAGASESKLLSGQHMIGTAYSVLGKWNEAGTCFEMCLKDDGALLTKEQKIQVMLQYTSVLMFRGKVNECIEYGQRAVELCKETFGDQAYQYADAASTLGALLDAVGRPDEAYQYFLPALEIYKKVWGEDHPRVSMALANIAVPLKKQGKYDEALAYYEQALFITKRVQGEDHVELASIYNNIGSTYMSMGDVKKGYENGHKALEMWNRVLGPDHQMTVMAKQYWSSEDQTRMMAQRMGIKVIN